MSRQTTVLRYRLSTSTSWFVRSHLNRFVEVGTGVCSCLGGFMASL